MAEVQQALDHRDTRLQTQETPRLGKRAQRALTKPVETRPYVRATEVLLAELKLVAPPNTLCEDRRRLPHDDQHRRGCPRTAQRAARRRRGAHRTQTDYNTKAPWLWSQAP